MMWSDQPQTEFQHRHRPRGDRRSPDLGAGHRSFRWEGFADAADTARHPGRRRPHGLRRRRRLGCTIGQGISGFSTLALGSMMTFAAIVASAAATLKYQYWRLLRQG